MLISVCKSLFKEKYAVININSIWDESLTLDAVGLLARLLCIEYPLPMPEKLLCELFNMPLSHLFQLLEELEENGYARRGEDGVSYEIFHEKNQDTQKCGDCNG